MLIKQQWRYGVFASSSCFCRWVSKWFCHWTLSSNHQLGYFFLRNVRKLGAMCRSFFNQFVKGFQITKLKIMCFSLCSLSNVKNLQWSLQFLFLLSSFKSYLLDLIMFKNSKHWFKSIVTSFLFGRLNFHRISFHIYYFKDFVLFLYLL